MSDSTRQFNFLAALTAVVVIPYVGASIYALVQRGFTGADFSGTVGPIACLLLGYWVRGEK